MKKGILLQMLLTCSLIANAQWRIGVTGGATYNNYMSDIYEGAWGATFGFMGQYDFCDWFGVRTDMNWTMKNHRQYINRIMYITTHEVVCNSYIQLPIMASFSIDVKKIRKSLIRGFLNTGIYGGYWLCSRNYEFVEELDQRYDCGFVGGGGVEWHLPWLKRNWVLQAEARVYYSTKSTQKNYMKISAPRYNTTWALQCGLCYLF